MGGFTLCQFHNVEKVLQRFEHVNIKEANTPFDWSIKLCENTGRRIAQLKYASVIGSIMYVMHCIRPSMVYKYGAISLGLFYSRFTSNPSMVH